MDAAIHSVTPRPTTRAILRIAGEATIPTTTAPVNPTSRLRLLASADLVGHPEVAWTEAYSAPRVRVSSFETPTEVNVLAAELADRLRTAWGDARRNAGRLEKVRERRGAATSWLRKAAKEFGFTIDER